MLKFKEFLSETSIEESRLLLAYDLYEWLCAENNILNEDVIDSYVQNEEEKEDEKKGEDKDNEADTEENKDTLIKNPLNKKEKDQNKEDEKKKDTIKNPIDTTAKDNEPKTDEEKADVWFEKLEASIGDVKSDKGFKNYKKASNVLIGRVYAFKYNPKHKNEMKFYDENPLVIPFEFKQTSGGSGFLGVNLHFIPRQQRKAVMKYFMEKDKVQVMKKGELKIDYLQNLKHNPKFRYIYYCIRHYLNSHAVGGFYAVPQEDYINVMNLYSAKYMKMTEYEIMNIIKNMYSKTLLTKSPGIQRIKKQKDMRKAKRKAKFDIKGLNNNKNEIDVLGDFKEKEKLTGNV